MFAFALTRPLPQLMSRTLSGSLISLMNDVDPSNALQTTYRHTLTLRQSVPSSRSVERVFESILDQERLPSFTRWHGIIPPVTRVEVDPDAPLRVGSQRRMFFAMTDGYAEVIEAIEQSPVRCSMRYRVVGAFPTPVSWFAQGAVGQYDVEKASEGTIATWTARIDLRSALSIPLGRAFGGLFVHAAMRGYLLAVTSG